MSVDSSRISNGGNIEDKILVGEEIDILLIEKGLKSRSLRDSVAFSKRRIDLLKVGLLTILN